MRVYSADISYFVKLRKTIERRNYVRLENAVNSVEATS